MGFQLYFLMVCMRDPTHLGLALQCTSGGHNPRSCLEAAYLCICNFYPTLRTKTPVLIFLCIFSMAVSHCGLMFAFRPYVLRIRGLTQQERDLVRPSMMHRLEAKTVHRVASFCGLGYKRQCQHFKGSGVLGGRVCPRLVCCLLDCLVCTGGIHG